MTVHIYLFVEGHAHHYVDESPVQTYIFKTDWNESAAKNYKNELRINNLSISTCVTILNQAFDNLKGTDIFIMTPHRGYTEEIIRNSPLQQF